MQKMDYKIVSPLVLSIKISCFLVCKLGVVSTGGRFQQFLHAGLFSKGHFPSFWLLFNASVSKVEHCVPLLDSQSPPALQVLQAASSVSDF